jgi:hypothetical protein
MKPACVHPPAPEPPAPPSISLPCLTSGHSIHLTTGQLIVQRSFDHWSNDHPPRRPADRRGAPNLTTGQMTLIHLTTGQTTRRPADRRGAGGARGSGGRGARGGAAGARQVRAASPSGQTLKYWSNTQMLVECWSNGGERARERRARDRGAGRAQPLMLYRIYRIYITIFM